VVLARGQFLNPINLYNRLRNRDAVELRSSRIYFYGCLVIFGCYLFYFCKL